MLYFAYGSNMDKLQMEEREVKFTSREFAILKGFRLVFNKKATAGEFSYANIEKDEKDFVEGVLYEVTESGISKLDKFEGYPKNYYKTKVDVVHNGKIVIALVYIANDDKVVENLLPKREYLNHILAGKDLISDYYFQRLLQVKTLD